MTSIADPEPYNHAARLFDATEQARDLGYRFHTCRIERIDGDKKVTMAPPKRWHEQAQQTTAQVTAAIRSGHTGYLIHCPSSGVTLLDADDAAGAEQLRHKELTGVEPHVYSPSGRHRSHTYVQGVYGTALDPKVKLTAFGPGSWVETALEGRQVYRGSLPERESAPVPRYVPPAAVRATHAQVPTGMLDAPGMNPPKTIETAHRQWERLHNDVVALVRRFESAGWEHTPLLPLTRELAQLAPGSAHQALDSWFREAGATYIDDRVWTMLDDAIDKWPADIIVNPAATQHELNSPLPGVPEIQQAGFSFEFLDPDREPEPPEPATLGGFGGTPLFYPRGVHWLQGESESGKSLIALAGPVLDAARAGGLVLYVDHESSRGDVQERLQQLGATADELRRVCYVPAAEVPHSAIVEHLTLSGRVYAVMVVDGVTSALNAAGLSGRDEQELTRWVDSLPRRAQMAVCIDHVVKATDQRNGMAIGSQAKKSVVTGSAFEVECTEKFGRGSSGQIVLWVQKDKPGWVRGAGVKKVRLSVTSAPATFALSVRVATGSAALDPFERWCRSAIEEGNGAVLEHGVALPEKGARALQRVAGVAGLGYSDRDRAGKFEVYQRLLQEYQIMTNRVVPQDPFDEPVPRTRSTVPGDPKNSRSDPVPSPLVPPGPAVLVPGTPTYREGYRVPEVPNQGTSEPDTSAFWGPA